MNTSLAFRVVDGAISLTFVLTMIVICLDVLAFMVVTAYYSVRKYALKKQMELTPTMIHPHPGTHAAHTTFHRDCEECRAEEAQRVIKVKS